MLGSSSHVSGGELPECAGAHIHEGLALFVARQQEQQPPAAQIFIQRVVCSLQRHEEKGGGALPLHCLHRATPRGKGPRAIAEVVGPACCCQGLLHPFLSDEDLPPADAADPIFPLAAPAGHGRGARSTRLINPQARGVGTARRMAPLQPLLLCAEPRP